MAETYSGEKLSLIGSKWLQRIKSAEKREKKWRDDAEAAEKAYTADEEATHGKCYDFNILHSNVETIVPAIYNSTPVPDIRRRFQDADPVGKVVSDVFERSITSLIDDNRLDTEMEKTAQDAFLAGRAILRLRFDADWDDETPAEQARLTDGEEMPGEGEDEMAEANGVGQPRNERILFEAVSWRDFRMGPAKRWADVSWVAFRHHIPHEEMERLSNPKLMEAQTGPSDPELSDKDEDDIEVWEVWCKSTKTVKFIRANDEKVLAIEDDPLELQDFFPVACPVQPISLTGKMMPVCPFVIYKVLADELDLITKRIRKITSVMKLKGVSFGEAGDLMELSEADDGEIIIARNMEQLAQTKGLDGAISWWPIERAATALQQLYLNREQTKQTIYEVTGISDIVRGQSNAGETATAQQIKTQWGSLRVQKMQRLLERQVRDVFVLMAEIISRHFSSETLMQMTGVQIDEQAEMLLRDQVRSHYRIDVETDSTVRADRTRMRGEMSEFLNGTGQFFGAVGPLVQEQPEMAQPMAEVYAAFARQFSLGKSAEDALESMSEMAKQPKPEQPDPEQMKAQAEMQAKQAEQQMKGQLEQQRMQIDAQFKEREAELQAREQAFREEQAQADYRLKERDQRLKEYVEPERVKIEWAKVGQGDVDRQLKATDGDRQDSREREKLASMAKAKKAG